jgi:hypothetical protein
MPIAQIKAHIKVYIWMIDALCQTSVARVSSFKDLRTGNVIMLTLHCVFDFSQYTWIADVEVVFNRGDQIFDRKVAKWAAVRVSDARLRPSQDLLTTTRVSMTYKHGLALVWGIVTTSAFQSITVSNVVLIFLSEFIVTCRSEGGTPENECFVDSKADSLYKIRLRN